MKDRTCFADEINFTSTEFDDDLMECDIFCELVKGLDQEVVFDMAQRLTSILGQEPAAEQYDEEEDDEEVERLTGGSADVRDRSLLLAGYTECMDEAIRYLVEEEQYSAEHPLVQGLRQHLVSEQDRVLAPALLDNARRSPNNNNNNNGDDNDEHDLGLVALLAGTVLGVRQPSSSS